MSRREFLVLGAAGLISFSGCRTAVGPERDEASAADTILFNGKITTLNDRAPRASGVAIKDGLFLAVGDEREVMAFRGSTTRVVDLHGKTVIPGLNDSHIHIIRGGLNYNMELRWDGVTSLADALRMLKEQADRTPPPQWVRVIGGWTEFQFREKRLPTLEEINAVSRDTPFFVLHLYDRAILNKAALRVLGYDRETPNPPGGEIQRDSKGNPSGLLIAKPNALILYASLARGPKLSYEDQINSTRQFMRELNRLGITSAIDAGGGFQSFPEDYAVIEDLAKQNLLTLRIAYNLFTQRAKQEIDDFSKWIKMVRPGQGSSFYRLNGAGEMIVFSAADFEDFLEPRPDLNPLMESELKAVVTLLAQNRWPFRIHATYDESITRFLNVFEEVNRKVPFDGLRWFFDHAETISEGNIDRVRALNGGIAIQDRMAFQGEYFVSRYGEKSAEYAPPIIKMLQAGIPIGAGTDATRVASYNPWVSLYWLISGKTVGGMKLYAEDNRLDRAEALSIYTRGSAWFSKEEQKKGIIEIGKFADLAVLSEDFFSVPEEKIKSIESVLTIVDGKVVYATDQFSRLSPPALPVSPDWSPVKVFGGYQRVADHKHALGACSGNCLSGNHQHMSVMSDSGKIWQLGCDCFAF